MSLLYTLVPLAAWAIPPATRHSSKALLRTRKSCHTLLQTTHTSTLHPLEVDPLLGTPAARKHVDAQSKASQCKVQSKSKVFEHAVFNYPAVPRQPGPHFQLPPLPARPAPHQLAQQQEERTQPCVLQCAAGGVRACLTHAVAAGHPPAGADVAVRGGAVPRHRQLQHRHQGVRERHADRPGLQGQFVQDCDCLDCSCQGTRRCGFRRTPANRQQPEMWGAYS